MRSFACWAASVLSAAALAFLSPVAAQMPERAPHDHSIAIPKQKLSAYFADMDARRLETLGLVDGGKYSVNLRRISAAEAALVHPLTANLRVVIEGSGTLTTGGVLQAGRISGGLSHPIHAGDVVYIPSGLPHGVSKVTGRLTWLDVRWDTDWPPASPMGAGTLAGLDGRAGDAPVVRAGLPAGSQQLLSYGYGGSGAMYFAKETLDQLMAGMRLKKSVLTRLVEGGRYNINLRWNGAPTTEIHEQTIDTWYVLAGEATVSTGHQVKDRVRVPGSGVTSPATAGDVFFIPAKLHHGLSEVRPEMFWLNIRWDDNYAERGVHP